MSKKWKALKNTDGKGGVRYREHQMRKHGAVPDRYYALQYWWQSKTINEGLGWTSDGWTPGKSFEELKKLKQNQSRGLGPCTMKEVRELHQHEKDQHRIALEAEAARRISMPQFFEEYFLPEAAIRWKHNTTDKAESHMKCWIKPVVGDTPLCELELLHVQRIKMNLLNAGRSPRTLQYIMRNFTMIWNAARDHGLTDKECPTKASSFRLPKVDNERMRVLTLEKETDLLEAVMERSEQAHDMTLVALDTGMRFGEIASLRWGNVDMASGTILVVNTKTSKDRAVPMTRRLKNLFASFAEGKPNKLVFANINGERHQQVPSLFKRAVVDAKLNEDVDDPKMKFSFHSLRHTAGTRYYRANKDLYLTQRFLGHSPPVMTTRYAKVADEDMRKGVEAMEQASVKKENNVHYWPQPSNGPLSIKQ
jgi:integrase